MISTATTTRATIFLNMFFYIIGLIFVPENLETKSPPVFQMIWVEQCHLHHPPVIAIFTGDMFTTGSHGWDIAKFMPQLPWLACSLVTKVCIGTHTYSIYQYINPLPYTYTSVCYTHAYSTI